MRDKSMFRAYIYGGNQQVDVTCISAPDFDDLLWHCEMAEKYLRGAIDESSTVSRHLNKAVLFTHSFEALRKYARKAQQGHMQLQKAFANVRFNCTYYDARDGGVIGGWFDFKEISIPLSSALQFIALCKSGQVKRCGETRRWKLAA